MKSSQLFQNQMLSQCRSHNQLHMLYSMLPKQYSLHPQQQFKKTKDFYKPDQYIWNNPHRTSERLYKYYHKGLDEYKRFKEPLITKQQQQDRQTKQLSRIRHLSIKRQESRFRFHSKQLERLNLQNRAGIVRDPSTQFIIQAPILSKNNFNHSYDQSNTCILRRSNSQSLRLQTNKNSKINLLYRNVKTSKEQQQTSVNEMLYLKSVQNCDFKNQALIQTIKKSQKQMKEQIRQNFVRQKQNNQLKNSTKHGLGQVKLVKSTFNKKKTLKFDFSNLSKKTLNRSNLQHQRS